MKAVKFFKQSYFKIVKIKTHLMPYMYSFKTIQFVPMQLEEAWDFFSNPANLKEITPPELGFNMISKYHGDKMYAGQIIEYKVKPVLGIPLYWMTEITHVQEQEYFVDEQRFGPYIFWHHQHHFKAVEGGVEMIDIVHYKLPLWILGTVANFFFVRKQLEGIFSYRKETIKKKFTTVC